MSPFGTFLIGLVILGLFCWYFITEFSLRKRMVGLALTLLLVAFSLESVYPPKEKIALGLDLKGGSSFLIKLVKNSEDAIITQTMQDKAVEVIRKRVDKYGVGEPLINPQGTEHIRVDIPQLDLNDLAEVHAQLEKVARLEFRMVHPDSDSLIPQISNGQAIIPPGYQIENYDEEDKGKTIKRQLLVKQKPDLSGESVSSAGAYYDQQGYGVSLTFDSAGASKFGELTAANVNKRFAIVLDGVVQSAPVIREAIYGGRATISGNFSEKEAAELASVLENPLETPVEIEEERTVSSTLGADSINAGISSILLGFGLVLLFVLIYYQFAGLVAVFGLMVNVILLFGIMSMFGFVLTLPGIAGIVLVVGMAIDANVLIYERIREELASGKKLAASVQGGYDKAFSAIFDANITTLITSAILFWKASGSVKGFAVTLTVGIAASMFSALLVTRNCFNWSLAAGFPKKLRMLHLVSSKSYDFIGKRKIALALSTILIIVCVGTLAYRGEKSLGIDFKGGDLVVLASEIDVAEGPVRDALSEIDLGDSVVQKLSTPTKELISIRSGFDTGDEIIAHLQKAIPDAKFTLDKLEKVGPVVGRELAGSSLWAIGLGLFAILVYLTLRFEFSFAIGALIALLHDIILTIGIIAIVGHEFSLIIVAAVLTVAGYSINDTIVVFDRIREGLRGGSTKRTTEAVLNESINSTLSRTVITSGLTLLSLVALYLYGGPVLEDFALAIITGVIVGTYSSIFVASPTALWWSKFRGTTLHHEVKKAEEDRARALASGN